MKQKAKASLKGGKTKELKVKTITKDEFSKNNKMKKKSVMPMKKKSAMPMKKKSAMPKALIGKQKNLPDALKKKILESPATMKKAAMKMKKESMAMLKKSAMMMKKAGAMKMKMKKK